MTLEQKLRTLRFANKLTFRKAAEGIGISASTLYEVEHGSMPRFDTAVAIARFYDVPITELAKLVNQ